MLDQLLHWDDPWARLALDVTLKATLLLAAAAIVALLSGRFSAALRHRAWALLFVALLLLPAASLALPQLALPIIPRAWLPATPESGPTTLADSSGPAASDHTVNDRTTNAVPDMAATGVGQTFPMQSDEESREVSHESASDEAERPIYGELPPPSAATPIRHGEPALASAETVSTRYSRRLKFAWLAGTALVLLPLISGVLGNLRFKRRGRPLFDPHWQRLLDDLCHQLALRREATLLMGESEQMPMTFGWTRPCIVLPAAALQWSDERRRVVLLHELAHIKRYDVPWQMVARLACAVYWFHPLAWWALRQMRLDREHACDDCVLAAGQKASHYASHLLEIARVHRASSPLATAALSMARRSQLEGRLLAVLDADRTRTPLGPARATGLVLATVAAVAVLGILRPALQAETVGQKASVASTAREKPAPQKGGPLTVRGTVLSPEGKPVAGAQVEVFATEFLEYWPIYRPRKSTIEYVPTSTDSAGRFVVSLPRSVSGTFAAMWALASAEGLALHQEDLKPQRAEQDVEIKLAEPTTIRVQLVDAVGNPAVGITPSLSSSWSTKTQAGYSVPSDTARGMSKLWPQWSTSDAQGYTSLTIERGMTYLQMLVEDERFGRQVATIQPVDDKPLAVALRPSFIVTGKVSAADTGEPLGGAEVMMMEQPYRRVRTAADGTYRIASALGGDENDRRFLNNEFELQVYPPADSPYLFLSIERQQPTDGSNTLDVPVKLWRGVMVEGRITDRATQRPIEGAIVSSRQQRYGNLLYHRGSQARFTGTDMNYSTDAEGHFRLPVWPGRGYLLVDGPTDDYLHVMLSDGDLYYGETGLERNYRDAAVPINFKSSETPAPLAIELERGVTLRRRVICPDGQPASGKAFARSCLLPYRKSISGYTRPIEIIDGKIELPGFGPEQSNPLFLIDSEHHCGATVSPSASEVDLTSPPIQLLPCGGARFHFVNDDNEPLADYEPWLHMVVTPGAPATHHIEADQPLWSDTIIWQNVARPAKVPKADAEGRVEVTDLIPGATYSVGYVNQEGRWDEGHEFTVRSGETVDVGEVVIPKHK